MEQKEPVNIDTLSAAKLGLLLNEQYAQLNQVNFNINAINNRLKQLLDDENKLKETINAPATDECP